jgi:hypothetical protein
MGTREEIGIWGRIGRIIGLLYDQARMILDLPTADKSLEMRLARLRRIYYADPKVTISYRRVRDILRGQVNPDYYPYYEKILAAERSLVASLPKLPPEADGPALLALMQTLGQKIAALIEDVEQADQLLKLYPIGSPSSESSRALRAWLLDQLKQALQVHNDIPLQVLNLRTQAGQKDYQARLHRLSLRLDEVNEASGDEAQLKRLMSQSES